MPSLHSHNEYCAHEHRFEGVVEYAHCTSCGCQLEDDEIFYDPENKKEVLCYKHYREIDDFLELERNSEVVTAMRKDAERRESHDFIVSCAKIALGLAS